MFGRWKSDVEAERRVEKADELPVSPTPLRYVWAALIVALALETANDLSGIGGPSALYQIWIYDGLLVASAVIVLARAAYEPMARSAWLAFGLAMASWSVGSILWSLVYGDRLTAPYPTFADVLWLLWYPLMALGISALIRVRFPKFELHRWMDGLAVTLLVLAVGFALVIQPVTNHTRQGTLATVVAFSYPILDVLLMGAILGVYGLLGWRPDRTWVCIGLGILAMTIADAAFAVQEAPRGVANEGHYEFVWTLGAVLIAYAAWAPGPRGDDRPTQVTGLRAVALPLLAQALAIGIQIYAIFEPIGKSERILTVAVLVLASVQIILTRPRPSPAAPHPHGAQSDPDEPAREDGISAARRIDSGEPSTSAD